MSLSASVCVILSLTRAREHFREIATTLPPISQNACIYRCFKGGSKWWQVAAKWQKWAKTNQNRSKTNHFLCKVWHFLKQSMALSATKYGTFFDKVPYFLGVNDANAGNENVTRYFSTRMRASTAMTSLSSASSGLMSISLISVAKRSRVLRRTIISA